MARVRIGHPGCHGVMAVMHSFRWRVLRQAEHRHRRGMVRTTFRHRHPCARPQPQGHQAQQKAKEKSAHLQMISQAPRRQGFSAECPLCDRVQTKACSRPRASQVVKNGCALRTVARVVVMWIWGATNRGRGAQRLAS